MELDKSTISFGSVVCLSLEFKSEIFERMILTDSAIAGGREERFKEESEEARESEEGGEELVGIGEGCFCWGICEGESTTI